LLWQTELAMGKEPKRLGPRSCLVVNFRKIQEKAYLIYFLPFASRGMRPQKAKKFRNIRRIKMGVWERRGFSASYRRVYNRTEVSLNGVWPESALYFRSSEQKTTPIRKARQNIFLAGFKPQAKKYQLKILKRISYD
jgi:hypothetical protein